MLSIRESPQIVSLYLDTFLGGDRECPKNAVINFESSGLHTIFRKGKPGLNYLFLKLYHFTSS